MAGAGKKFIFAHHFKGKPREENFRLVEEPLPASLADGGKKVLQYLSM